MENSLWEAARGWAIGGGARDGACELVAREEARLGGPVQQNDN